MPFHDLGALEVTLIFLAALFGGFVDAIVGGGGLVTVPALAAVGLPPHFVLGTNKGAAMFGSGSSLLRYARSGLVDKALAPKLFVCGILGAPIGAWLVTQISPAKLKPVVVVMLIAAAVVVFVVRKPSVTGRPRVLPALLLVSFAIGIYDGFFGPGTGTLLIAGFALFGGFNLTASSANAKVVNFATNIAAVSFFAYQGFIIWKIVLPMAIAQFIGGTLGAQMAVKRGARLIQGLLTIVVCALVAKLCYELVMGRSA